MLFYLNKGFYSYISFNSNFILYKITHERLKIIKIKEYSLKDKRVIRIRLD